MDEAFSALDPLIRSEMQEELLRLQAEHSRTIVFVTHDIDEAMRIGDRIAIMQDGSIVQIGTPEEIVLNPANEYVRSFFQSVDVSRVFRAKDVARGSQVTLIDRSGVAINVALERLRRHDRDVAMVVSRDRKFQGVVTAESLSKAIADGGSDPFHQAFLPDVDPLDSEEPLTNVLARVAGSRWPVPVVDSQHRYVGAISKSALLLTLDRSTP